MDWPGKNKPEAEPGCGFLNEHCPKDDTHLRSIVAAGVLAVLLFCAAVITMSIYRRWKIEQEIEGLLWKIDPSEIHGYPHLDNMMSSPSKVRYHLPFSNPYINTCVGTSFYIYLHITYTLSFLFYFILIKRIKIHSLAKNVRNVFI